MQWVKAKLKAKLFWRRLPKLPEVQKTVKKWLETKKKSQNPKILTQFLWQRVKDSNPHKRSQSPVCYLYTTPLNARIIIHSFSDLSTHFFTRFRCFRNTLPPAPHNSLQAGPRTPRSFSAQAPGRSFEESPRTRRWKPSARGFQTASNIRFPF